MIEFQRHILFLNEKIIQTLLKALSLTTSSSHIYPVETLWTSEDPSCRAAGWFWGRTRTAKFSSRPEHRSSSCSLTEHTFPMSACSPSCATCESWWPAASLRTPWRKAETSMQNAHLPPLHMTPGPSTSSLKAAEHSVWWAEAFEQIICAPEASGMTGCC